jgi:hypothetical protein
VAAPPEPGVARARAAAPPPDGAAARPTGPNGIGGRAVATARPVGVPPVGSGPASPVPLQKKALAAAREAPAQLREQMRDPRNVRLGMLVLGILVVLVGLPMYSWARAESRDPVFAQLDALAVPAWANTKPEDRTDGSRWCLEECRFRERVTHSANPPEETAKAYHDALAAEGWRRWQPAKCPETKVDGSYTCWTRDELTMDLWIRAPACNNVPIGVEPQPGASAAPTAGAPPGDCTGSDVSIKVRNAIGDDRTEPQPAVDPSSVGETPFGLDPTTAPS